MGDLIERKELYNLVWSKPITEIAKDYKVSDSAIIKICKKMEIPRPGLGYWTKVECGKQVTIPPLPKLSKKGVDRHYLWRQGYSQGQTDNFGAQHPHIAQEADPAFAIAIAPRLADPHPTTAINIKRFRNAKTDDKGILHPRANRHFDMQVTKGTEDRALRIMDALLKAFALRGWDFHLRPAPNRAMLVTVIEEDIRFSIEELVGAIDHVLTTKEKRAQTKGDWVCPPRYDYVPSGKLKIHLHTYYGYPGRSSWSDAKIQRVEKSLNKFCAGLVQYALAIKAKRIQDEKDRIKHSLESSAWERRRGRIEYDEKMRAQLTLEVRSWRFAEDIRAYVSASSNTNDLDAAQAESHDKWSQWALAYASSIDPLAGGTPLGPENEKKQRYFRPY